jgi:hypothetical protein
VRLLIVALCGASLGATRLNAQNLSLRLSSANAVIESEVSLDLTLTSTGGVRPASIQWKVEYSTRDFALSDVKIGPAAIAAGKTLTCQGQGGQRTCILTGLGVGQVNSNPIGDGIVARVVLYVLLRSEAHRRIRCVGRGRRHPGWRECGNGEHRQTGSRES